MVLVFYYAPINSILSLLQLLLLKQALEQLVVVVGIVAASPSPKTNMSDIVHFSYTTTTANAIELQLLLLQSLLLPLLQCHYY